ncbi:MAG: endonuclease domain-containing protein [Sphingorhabdus sp.]|uniref:endonuclease domain-containing protein n=1 Tax=Sphingorhabdus sp. TaxID=1902408 RepID=UPI003C823560
MPDFSARNTDRAKELRNSATPPEKRLWLHLRNRNQAGHKFSRQMPIGPYFCDFLCRASKLVIEVDGQGHDQTFAHDTRRTVFLQNAGYQVIRFSNLQIMNELEDVLKTIELALAGRPTPNPSRKREGRMETARQQRENV